MNVETELPKRKMLRLQNFDYNTNGAYFITICTKDRKNLLSKIITVGDDAHIVPKINLSNYGLICDKYIKNIDNVYKNVSMDKYVIMPDHIHLIIVICGTMKASSPTENIETVIRSFKTMVTKEIGFSIWQRSFYDHVIRNHEDYLEITKYIQENPEKWIYDE